MNISGALLLLREFLDQYRLRKSNDRSDWNLKHVPVTFETRTRGRPVESATAEEHFQEHFFDFLIDTAKISIAERFEAFSAHSQLFSFLYDTELIEERYDNGTLQTFCTNLEETLTQNGQSDIDGK